VDKKTIEKYEKEATELGKASFKYAPGLLTSGVSPSIFPCGNSNLPSTHSPSLMRLDIETLSKI